MASQPLNSEISSRRGFLYLSFLSLYFNLTTQKYASTLLPTKDEKTKGTQQKASIKIREARHEVRVASCAAVRA